MHCWIQLTNVLLIVHWFLFSRHPFQFSISHEEDNLVSICWLGSLFSARSGCKSHSSLLMGWSLLGPHQLLWSSTWKISKHSVLGLTGNLPAHIAVCMSPPLASSHRLHWGPQPEGQGGRPGTSPGLTVPSSPGTNAPSALRLPSCRVSVECSIHTVGLYPSIRLSTHPRHWKRGLHIPSASNVTCMGKKGSLIFALGTQKEPISLAKDLSSWERRQVWFPGDNPVAPRLVLLRPPLVEDGKWRCFLLVVEEVLSPDQRVTGI